MHYRSLGSTGIEIAPLVFGGNVFGWTCDTSRSHALLDRFVELGLNCIDTADLYSAWVPGNKGGESEIIIGEWLKARGGRDKIVLSTKVGMWEKRKGLSAANIETALEDSLKRLNTDYIDVYFAHIDDPDTPLEQTLRTFERLIKSGKVRSIGASNYSAPRLAAALEVSRTAELPRYQVMQPLYNLYSRAEFESELAPFAESEQMGVIVYFALASGFLSGKYTQLDQIRGTARERMLEKYFTPRGQRILGALLDISKQTGATPAQIALAWLLKRPAVTAPIVSATRIEQLDELVASLSVDLSDQAMTTLNQASSED